MPAPAEKQRLASVFPNPYLNDPEPSPDLLTNTRCSHRRSPLYNSLFHFTTAIPFTTPPTHP